MAVDCQHHVVYVVNHDLNWRDHGQAVEAGSVSAEELRYVCANAP